MATTTELYVPLADGDITWTGHVRDTCVFSLLPGEESDLLRGVR